MKLTTIPQFARNANRLREILTILSKYGLADWVSRLDFEFAKSLFKGRDGPGLTELTRESRIRRALQELGTTFVKVGQLLSTRPDLVGPELARELTALQDNVPADPPATVRTTIESELGQPLEEVFATFEERPLASASIAQVHGARLKSGQPVVVKVQHAAIETRVRTDLDILVGLADLAEKYVAEFRPYRPRTTAAEFQRLVLRELDFGREERNLQQFATYFAADTSVRFPAVYPELSTGRVLTMERLEGVKIAEPQQLHEHGFDLEEVARRGAEVFLEMIFRDGFYHADPHPGNLLVLPGGVIGLLDCGMVGRIDDRMREQIEDMLAAMVGGDSTHLTSILTGLGSLPPEADLARLRADVDDFLGYYRNQSLDQFDLGGALNELIAIIRRHQILLPTGIALLFKVLIMLEGTSRLLNPHFNLTELLRPYQQKLLWRRLSPARHLQKLRRLYHEWESLGELLPRGLADVLRQMQTGKLHVRLEHERVETAANRLVTGMLASALFVGSALLWARQVPPLVDGVSVFGSLGCAASLVLGLRLLWIIWRSGRRDR
jgi:ubiquinone biosynthesis protein